MSEQADIRNVFIAKILGSALSEPAQVGIRLLFIIIMFLGGVVSVSEQVGIRPVFIDMFLVCALRVSEQVSITPVFIDMILGSALSEPGRYQTVVHRHVPRRCG